MNCFSISAHGLFDENILFSLVRGFKHFNKENLFDKYHTKINRGNTGIKCYNTLPKPAAILSKKENYDNKP